MLFRPAFVVACVSMATAAAAGTPRDFAPEVHALYAVAACGDAAPAEYDAKVVAAHCNALSRSVASWRTNWRDKAVPFFTKLLASGYPRAVVYPFGGGDLLTALTVYPDATDYTTLSLEGMGDPRPIIRTKHLADRLAVARTTLAKDLSWAWNTTIQLSIDSSESGNGLPVILTLALVALDASGYEPLEARFFRLDGEGHVVYLTQDDIDAWDAEAKPAKRKPTNSVQRGAFNDVEIVFRKKGDASAPKKTFRHVAADLSDAGYDADHGAVAYVEHGPEVAAITKAASYLLWKPTFGKIRNALLARMKLMVSDDTGIPPRFATPAGFTQEVWGTYRGAYFDFALPDIVKEMVALWKGPANKGAIGFRFGYYDKRGREHLMYTYRSAPPTKPPT